MTIKTFRGFVLPIVLLCFCFFTFTRPMNYNIGGQEYHPTGFGFPFIYNVDTSSHGLFWLPAFLLNLFTWIAFSLALFLLIRKILPRFRFEPSLVVRVTLLLISVSVFTWYFAGSLFIYKIGWSFHPVDESFWPTGICIF